MEQSSDVKVSGRFLVSIAELLEVVKRAVTAGKLSGMPNRSRREQTQVASLYLHRYVTKYAFCTSETLRGHTLLAVAAVKQLYE